MPKKKRTPFATDKDGKDLFVELKASGIHPWVACADCMTLVFFGNERKAYLRVEDVAAWHEKELRESKGMSGSKVALDALREIMRKFRAGEVTDA